MANNEISLPSFDLEDTKFEAEENSNTSLNHLSTTLSEFNESMEKIGYDGNIHCLNSSQETGPCLIIDSARNSNLAMANENSKNLPISAVSETQNASQPQVSLNLTNISEDSDVKTASQPQILRDKSFTNQSNVEETENTTTFHSTHTINEEASTILPSAVEISQAGGAQEDDNLSEATPVSVVPTQAIPEKSEAKSPKLSPRSRSNSPAKSVKSITEELSPRGQALIQSVAQQKREPPKDTTYTPQPACDSRASNHSLIKSEVLSRSPSRYSRATTPRSNLPDNDFQSNISGLTSLSHFPSPHHMGLGQYSTGIDWNHKPDRNPSQNLSETPSENSSIPMLSKSHLEMSEVMKEQHRRQVCEQQITRLQSKILHLQQKIRVFAASEQHTKNSINGVNEAVARLLKENKEKEQKQSKKYQELYQQNKILMTDRKKLLNQINHKNNELLNIDDIENI